MRSLPVFGHDAGGGHCETLFEDVRVPKEYLLGEEGGGFAIAQARLGPGRIHHCMRAIGMAEKALGSCASGRSSGSRSASRSPTRARSRRRSPSRASRSSRRACSRMKAAWLMDTVGKKGARFEIAAIKVVAARLATTVIDRAIQAFGGAGVSDDWPLAEMYAHARTLHLVDGPDEVHLQQIARRELRAVRAVPRRDATSR